jgi:intracellular multiplication protein IcmL
MTDKIDKDLNKNNKVTKKSKENKSDDKNSHKKGLNTVVERREFYMDMYSKMWKIALVGVTSMIISLVMTIIVINKKESNAYFAVDQNYSLIKLIALHEPNVKNGVVANWLTRALVNTFDFNYYNIKSHLNESSMKWFTSEGASELIKALDDSGNFDVIVERKLIVSLVVNQVPVVVKEGVINGVKLWKLQVPAVMTYRNESSVSSNEVIFTVTVSRVSLLTDPVGLGIAKIIMEKK